MDPVRILADTALFRGFPAEQLEPLAPALKRQTFARDSYIFHEGDPGNRMYVIVSGEVKISRTHRRGDEAVMVVLMPGDIFGELALFQEGASRTADAQALEPTECITLDWNALRSFMEQHSALMLHFIKILSAYVRRQDETFAEVSFLDIPGRVARTLLELAANHGERTAEGTRIRMRISQRTLAGMVAASRENVNRALARFAAHGDIKIEGGVITVLKPEALRSRS